MAGKDVRQYLRKLRKRGYVITQQKRTAHYRVYSEAGELVTITGCSPSDFRALYELRAAVARFEAT